MSHTVATRHIRRLIRNANTLAEAVDGQAADTLVVLPDDIYEGAPYASVEDCLTKAVADLRHAADELDAERLSCSGWRQV